LGVDDTAPVFRRELPLPGDAAERKGIDGDLTRVIEQKMAVGFTFLTSSSPTPRPGFSMLITSAPIRPS